MKASQLKAIVKEIVRQVMETRTQDYTVSADENGVAIEDFKLNDGQVVSGLFYITGDWEKSGIGSYEFHGQKSFDRGSDQWNLGSWNLVQILDQATGQQLDPKDPSNKPIVDALNAAMEDSRDTIEAQFNENPPSPDVDDRGD